VSYSNTQPCQEQSKFNESQGKLEHSGRTSDTSSNLYLCDYMRHTTGMSDRAELHDIDLKARTYRRSPHITPGPVLATIRIEKLAVRFKQQK
jgi:hypothetical protein